jgi:tetratricopeptide (TPR) repeat protein
MPIPLPWIEDFAFNIALRHGAYAMFKKIIPLLALVLALAGCSSAMKGNMALTGHRYQESIREYQQALQEHPGDAHIQSRLGLAYYRDGRYPESAQTLETLLAAHPMDPEGPIFLGLAYLAQGDRDKGFASFERFQSTIYRERRNVLTETARFRGMPKLNLAEVETTLFQAIADGYEEQDQISRDN